MCVCVHVNVYVCRICVCVTTEVRAHMLNSLGLELQAAVICHVGTGTRTQVPCKKEQVFLPVGPTPAVPLHCSFLCHPPQVLSSFGGKSYQGYEFCCFPEAKSLYLALTGLEHAV